MGQGFVNLQELVSVLDVEKVIGPLDRPVRGLTYDSRKAERGFLFVAIPGFREDGHKFIPQAVKKGARVVVVEKEALSLPPEITRIRVRSSREALAKLSSYWYGFPSRKLKLIGVTGTNGKTTTTYLIESILKKAGYKVGRLSTINYDLGSGPIPSRITTPESQDLQEMLHKMVDGGVDYAVMEVSSHSLVLHRVDGVQFDFAVLTNFSIDHLDFHKSMERYLEAKISLFRDRRPRRAIVNVDDPMAHHFIDSISCPLITYAIKNEARVKGKILKIAVRGSTFLAQVDGCEPLRINLPFLGPHNVYNALAAISTAAFQAVEPLIMKEGLERIERIPGRLEYIQNRRDLDIFVDYAHTPDALENVLKALRQVARGKLWVVFGCGGDRDTQKHPLMGKVSLKFADYSVITSDNPRSEDPEKIIAAIEEGVREDGGRRGKDYTTVVDRIEAIRMTLEEMRKGDILLIAGKGHEKVQIFKDRVVEFSDSKVVRDLLSRR
jgi:UDP-N-acetylmuramoyl-L-alanyl-D-glutamate--2,6-diaminopimelate ligase